MNAGLQISSSWFINQEKSSLSFYRASVYQLKRVEHSGEVELVAPDRISKRFQNYLEKSK